MRPVSSSYLSPPPMEYHVSGGLRQCLSYYLPLGNSLLCCGWQLVPSMGRLTRYSRGTSHLTQCACRWMLVATDSFLHTHTTVVWWVAFIQILCY